MLDRHIVVVIRIISKEIAIKDEDFKLFLRAVEDSCFVFGGFDSEYIKARLGKSFMDRLGFAALLPDCGGFCMLIIGLFFECVKGNNRDSLESDCFLDMVMTTLWQFGFIAVGRDVDGINSVVRGRLQTRAALSLAKDVEGVLLSDSK